MKKKWKGSLFIVFVAILAACSNNETVQEVTPVHEESVADLQLGEVQAMIKTTIDGIYHTFNLLGEEHNWNTANPADFSLIRPEVLPFATEEFADAELKTLSEDYYCECDTPFRPAISYDVHFTFEQKAEELTVEAIQPATEVENVGYSWSFKFIYDQDAWKLNAWERKSLNGTDLQLTQKEAALLLPTATSVDFLKEFDSKETGGKAYLFFVQGKTKDREYEYQLALSSKDTRYVYDHTPEPQETEAPEAKSKPSQEGFSQNPEVTLSAYTKEELLAELDQLAKQEIHREYQNDNQMIEDYVYNFHLWDQALNHIYSEIKMQTIPMDFPEIRNKQRQWITERDAEAQKSYDEAGGGSLSRVVQNETMFKLTKERCYELVNTYIN